MEDPYHWQRYEPLSNLIAALRRSDAPRLLRALQTEHAALVAVLQTVLAQPPPSAASKQRVDSGVLTFPGGATLKLDATAQQVTHLVATIAQLDEVHAAVLYQLARETVAERDASPMQLLAAALDLRHRHRLERLALLMDVLQGVTDPLAPEDGRHDLRRVLDDVLTQPVAQASGPPTSFVAQLLQTMAALQQEQEQLQTEPALAPWRQAEPQLVARTRDQLRRERTEVEQLLFVTCTTATLPPDDIVRVLQQCQQLVFRYGVLPQYHVLMALLAQFQHAWREDAFEPLTDADWIRRVSRLIDQPAPWASEAVRAVVLLHWAMFLHYGHALEPRTRITQVHERLATYLETSLSHVFSQPVFATLIQGTLPFMKRTDLPFTAKITQAAADVPVEDPDNRNAYSEDEERKLEGIHEQRQRQCRENVREDGAIWALVTEMLRVSALSMLAIIRIGGLRLLKELDEDATAVAAASAATPYTSFRGGYAAGPSNYYDLLVWFILLFKDAPEPVLLDVWNHHEWFIQCGTSLYEPDLMTVHLHLIAVLANGPQCAKYASRLMETNSAFSWSTFFQSLHDYQRDGSAAAAAQAHAHAYSLAVDMDPRRGSGGGSSDMAAARPWSFPLEDLPLMKAFLALLRTCVTADATCRVALFENTTYAPVHNLFALATTQVPLELKADLFATIAAFATPFRGDALHHKTPAVAALVWGYLEQAELLVFVPRSRRHQVHAGPHGAVSASSDAAGPAATDFQLMTVASHGLACDLNEVESAYGVYPETLAVLNLLATLLQSDHAQLRHTMRHLGSKTREPGLRPYLAWIVDHIFLKLTVRPFVDDMDRYRMLDVCLTIFDRCLELFARDVLAFVSSGMALMDAAAPAAAHPQGEAAMDMDDDSSRGAAAGMDASVHEELMALGLHPGFEIACRLLTGSKFKTTLFSILDIPVAALTGERDDATGPLAEKCVNRALSICHRMILIQKPLLDVVAPQMALDAAFARRVLLPSLLNTLETLFAASYTTVVNLAVLVTNMENTAMCRLVVALLRLLAASPVFQKVNSQGVTRMAVILSAAPEAPAILAGFARLLERPDGDGAHDGASAADALGYSGDADAATMTGIHPSGLGTSLRTAICDFLLESLTANEQDGTVAHFLLGFDVTPGYTKRSIPLRDTRLKTCFRTLIDGVIRAPTTVASASAPASAPGHAFDDSTFGAYDASGMASHAMMAEADPFASDAADRLPAAHLAMPAALTERFCHILYLLATSARTHEPTIKYLRVQEDFFARCLLRLPFVMDRDRTWTALLQHRTAADGRDESGHPGVPDAVIAQANIEACLLNQQAWLIKMLCMEVHSVRARGPHTHLHRLLETLYINVHARPHVEQPLVRILELVNAMSLEDLPEQSFPPVMADLAQAVHLAYFVTEAPTGAPQVDLRAIHTQLMALVAQSLIPTNDDDAVDVAEWTAHIPAFMTLLLCRNVQQNMLHARRHFVQAVMQLVAVTAPEYLASARFDKGPHRIKVLVDILSTLVSQLTARQTGGHSLASQIDEFTNTILTLTALLRQELLSTSPTLSRRDADASHHPDSARHGASATANAATARLALSASTPAASTSAAGAAGTSSGSGALVSWAILETMVGDLLETLSTTKLTAAARCNVYISLLHLAQIGGLGRDVRVAQAWNSVVHPHVIERIVGDTAHTTDGLKCVAFSLLTVLAVLPKTMAYLGEQGFVKYMLSTLVNEGPAMQKRMAAALAAQHGHPSAAAASATSMMNLLCVYDIKMQLFLQIAETSGGRRMLADSRLFETLTDCTFLWQTSSEYLCYWSAASKPHHAGLPHAGLPHGGSTGGHGGVGGVGSHGNGGGGSGGGGASGMPSLHALDALPVTEQYHNLLMPALSLIAHALAGAPLLGSQQGALIQSCLQFIGVHKAFFLTILQDRLPNRKVTLPGLTKLVEVTRIFKILSSHTTARRHPLLCDDGESTLRTALVRLLPKYGRLEKWLAQLEAVDPYDLDLQSMTVSGLDQARLPTVFEFKASKLVDEVLRHVLAFVTHITSPGPIFSSARTRPPAGGLGGMVAHRLGSASAAGAGAADMASPAGGGLVATALVYLPMLPTKEQELLAQSEPTLGLAIDLLRTTANTLFATLDTLNQITFKLERGAGALTMEHLQELLGTHLQTATQVASLDTTDKQALMLDELARARAVSRQDARHAINTLEHLLLHVARHLAHLLRDAGPGAAFDGHAGYADHAPTSAHGGLAGYAGMLADAAGTSADASAGGGAGGAGMMSPAALRQQLQLQLGPVLQRVASLPETEIGGDGAAGHAATASPAPGTAGSRSAAAAAASTAATAGPLSCTLVHVLVRHISDALLVDV